VFEGGWNLRLVYLTNILWLLDNNSAGGDWLLNNLLADNLWSLDVLDGLGWELWDWLLWELFLDLFNYFFRWSMNNLFFNGVVFYSFLVSFLSDIINIFISINIWNVFSLIFNWNIFSLFFFMWNIINFIDSVICSEGFFEWDIFHSWSSCLDLMLSSFKLGTFGNLVSFNNSVNGLWSLLNYLGNLNWLDDLRALYRLYWLYNWLLLNKRYLWLNILYLWLLNVSYGLLNNGLSCKTTS
jgi:hypothetical protein